MLPNDSMEIKINDQHIAILSSMKKGVALGISDFVYKGIQDLMFFCTPEEVFLLVMYFESQINSQREAEIFTQGMANYVNANKGSSKVQKLISLIEEENSKRNNKHEKRDQNLWEYGTNPEYEVSAITTSEVRLQQYVEDNSAILKRGFWAKRNLGVVLINFDNYNPELIFIDKSTLSMNLPSNVASDALIFLNSNGRLYGKSEGLILIAKLGNNYSIQDYPLHGRDVGLSYLVE
ncbi:hypothetical protein [Nostoc sp. WHI]|uniref:hypothetical protein n=1 Tax=Nostoc sp. WHI TaxID=2650611 RepID=UPI0018C5CDF4|nr:hypothetical protein [Nostoc sp. WHI]MBG1267857.1 hypothetical protein [Nostoc sp. WHI]